MIPEHNIDIMKNENFFIVLDFSGGRAAQSTGIKIEDVD